MMTTMQPIASVVMNLVAAKPFIVEILFVRSKPSWTSLPL